MSAVQTSLAGWQPRDLVTAAIALASLGLSVVNFRTAQYLARRSFAQLYGEDVTKWAADGLSFYRDFEHVALFPPHGELLNVALRDLRSRADYLVSTGYLLFPSEAGHDADMTSPSYHPLLVILTNSLVSIESFLGVNALVPETIKLQEIRASRGVFLGEARKLVGTNERVKLLARQ